MEKLRGNDCEDSIFLISRGIQFQSWGGGRNQKTFSPILNHHLRSGDYGFCLKVQADYVDILADMYVLPHM